MKKQTTIMELSKMSTLEKIVFYDELSKEARNHELNTRRTIRQEDAKDQIHRYWFTTKSQLEAKADKYAEIALRIKNRLYVLTNIYLLNL